MRILIYGFSSRLNSVQVNPQTYTFAKLMQLSYASLGHDVHVGTPPDGLSAKNLLAYDKVLIGISSPKSLVGDGSYVASYMIGHLRGTGKLILYFDNPMLDAVVRGVLGWVNKPAPADIFRSGYKKRKLWYDPVLDKDSADRWAAWHVDVMRFILGRTQDDPYPPVLLPLFDWANIPAITKALPDKARANVRGIDPTQLFTIKQTFREPIRDKVWMTKDLVQRDFIGWVKYQHTDFPVVALRAKAHDTEYLRAFQRSWGYLHSPPMHHGAGWWTTHMLYGVSSGALLLTEPESVRPLGESFSLLAASTEHLTYDERDELADAQYKSFYEHSATKERIKEKFEEVLHAE